MRARAKTTAVASAVLAVIAAAATALPASAAPAPTVTNGCITSVPDPGTTAPVQICYSLFEPVGASSSHKVPMIMHSHGWGGSRTTDPASFSRFLNAGYGVLSFDQRGFGESGGQAYVENPDVEGHDVRGLVDLISKLNWVQQDGPGDPHMGAIGGSYGGGYQFLGAFEELRTKGKPIFDALAPEITWNDLHDSLAPHDVVRTEWALALSAAAVPSDSLPHSTYEALVEGAALGTWPDGSTPGTENLTKFFQKNGPAWHVAHGRKLNIPVLFGQGITDSLFNLQQGLTNWSTALTDNARKHSIFVGYNGGHTLPNVFPQGVSVSSDPCSKQLAGDNFEQLSLRFFDETLKGKHTGLTGWGKYHLATAGSTCTTVSSVVPNKAFNLGQVITTQAAGPPLTTQIAAGPIRIAGSGYLTAKVTTLTPGSRAFYGLAIGTSPGDAKLVQDNVMPINEPSPVTGVSRKIELPAVAVDVPAGQNLYLMATAFSDMFAGMGSRTPGVVQLDNTQAHLHVVG
jgi:pimeloyl-ACP methyl ester carboxylesterase